jgi:hypothetical protein
VATREVPVRWTLVVAGILVSSGIVSATLVEVSDAEAQPVCHYPTPHHNALFSDGSPAYVHMEAGNCTEVFFSTFQGIATTALTNHNSNHSAFNPLQTTAMQWGSDRCVGSPTMGTWKNRFSAQSNAYGWYFSGQAVASGSYYNCPEAYPHEYRLQSSHYFYNYNWSTYWLSNFDFVY